MTDRVLRAIITGSSAGAVAAFSETAAASDAAAADMTAKMDASTAASSGFLGRLSSTMKANGVPFSGAVSKMQGGLEDVGAAGEGAGASLAGPLGAAALIAGGLLVGFGVKATEAATTFQGATTKIANAAGIPVSAAQKISDAFLSTGGKTTVSAQELADAYGTVAGMLGQMQGKALNSTQALGFMKAATDLAEGSGQALGSSTTDLANTMQAFQVPTAKAKDVADDLFNTSKATGVGIDSLSSTIDRLKARLGITAPTLGSMSSMLIDLSEHGVTGSRGLQVVNTAMTTLTGGSKKTDDTLSALGVHVFDSSGKFVGFGSVISQLQPKLAGMTQQQQLATLQNIVGTSSAKALLATIDGGSASYDKATAAVNRHGAAAAAATAYGKTFQGSMETLKSAASDLEIQIGQKLLPVFTSFVQNLVSAAQWINEHWSGISQVFTETFRIIKVAFDGFVGTFRIAFGAIEGIVEVFKGIFTGNFSDIWKGLKDIFLTPWTVFKGAFDDALNALPAEVGQLPGKIISALGSLAGDLGNLAVEAWNSFINAEGQGWSRILDDAEAIPGKILGALASLGSDLLNLGHDAIVYLYNGITGEVSAIYSFFNGLWHNIETAIGDLFNDALNIGKRLMDGLVQGIENGVGAVINKIKSVGSDIKNGFSSVLSILSPSRVFAQYGQYLMQGLSQGIDQNSHLAVGSIAKVAAQLKTAPFTVGSIASAVAAGGSSNPALVAGQSVAGATSVAGSGQQVNVNVTIPMTNGFIGNNQELVNELRTLFTQFAKTQPGQSFLGQYA